MHERLMGRSRGQTLIETAICLPIVLAALFGVIYYCNLGTVNARLQLTVRYGALNLFAANSGPAYSASNIYNGVSGSAVCPAPPTTLLSNGSPLPAGDASDAFWNPDPSSTLSTCTLQTKDLGGASFLMARYLTAGNVSVSAKPSVAVIPATYTTEVTGGGVPTKTASLPWVHAAWPAAIIACISKTGNEVEDLLTATETVNLPTGWSPGNCNLK